MRLACIIVILLSPALAAAAPPASAVLDVPPPTGRQASRPADVPPAVFAPPTGYDWYRPRQRYTPPFRRYIPRRGFRYGYYPYYGHRLRYTSWP